MIASVISAGFQTTVQDCGRIGFRKFGVMPGGALDSLSLRLANLLVGNDDCLAGLEIVSGGVRLKFSDDRLIAWSGGDFDFRIGSEPVPKLHCCWVSAGEICEISARHGRAWLAISGGCAVPEVLGSRSTDTRAKFGGLEGRALRTGDEISLGPQNSLAAKMRAQISNRISDWSAPQLVMPTKILRIIPGKHWDEKIGTKLLSGRFRVAMNSDRMGLRLEGEKISLPNAAELVSEAVAPGTIQLPPGGGPIVLIGDCQTIGGYPKLAHVIAVDLARAAQMLPLDEVRFELITLEQAQELLRERERDIALFRAGLEARFG